MKRSIIAGLGAIVSLGFLAASAVANYLFGASLGRTPHDEMLYGAVGVLAVAMNALAPFYISWSLEAKRRTTAGGIVVLWALCLAYSTTSALGFAAQNREDVATSRQLSQDAYADIRRELLDLEIRHKSAIPKDRARLEKRIDDARVRLAAVRNNNPAPACRLVRDRGRNVRYPRPIRCTIALAICHSSTTLAGAVAARSWEEGVVSEHVNLPLNTAAPRKLCLSLVILPREVSNTLVQGYENDQWSLL